MSPSRGGPPAHPQLDEISSKIGELGAYVHEHRHGVNNLSLKFDALSVDLAKRVEALDLKMAARIEEMGNTITRRLDALEERIETLETDKHKRDGAVGLVEWLMRYWPGVIAYIGLVALMLRANGKL